MPSFSNDSACGIVLGNPSIINPFLQSWELKLPAKQELKKEFTQKVVPVTDSAT